MFRVITIGVGLAFCGIALGLAMLLVAAGRLIEDCITRGC